MKKLYQKLPWFLITAILFSVVGYGVFKFSPLYKAQAACTPATGYTYCNTIVIDHTKVSTVNQQALTGGFVVEASSTDAHLATTGHSGHVQNTTTETGSSYTGQVPADFVVSTSSSYSALLPGWEFESYSSTTGNIILFMNLGNSVSTSSDTTIYESYGDSAVTTWQGSVSGTWTNYVGVWHFPNGSSLNVTDSSGVNSSSDGGATAASTIIDGGANFVAGSSQYVDTGAKPVHGSAFSIQCWYLPTNVSTGEIMANGYPGLGVPGMGIQFFNVSNGTNWEPRGYVNNASTGITVNSGDTYFSTFGNWASIVLTYNGSTSTIFSNGISRASTASALGSLGTASFTYFVGAYNQYPQSYLTGNVDECRLSATALSPDWISTEYNNESAPDKGNYGSGGFYTIGTEQSGGGGGGTPALPPQPIYYDLIDKKLI